MKELLTQIKTKCLYYSSDKIFEVFNEYWNNTKSSFVKLETLQQYDVSEDPNYEAYIKGDYSNFLVALKEFYQSEVKYINANISQKRLHYVKYPFSQYVAYEFYSYLISKALGEEIKCKVLEEDDNRLINMDFVLFDENAIIIHQFDNDGVYLGGWCYCNSSGDSLLSELKKEFECVFDKENSFEKYAEFDINITKEINLILNDKYE